ncbi:MAG: hypothetical protein ACR2LS_04415 [Thermomicrobiales bacterium]
MDSALNTSLTQDREELRRADELDASYLEQVAEVLVPADEVIGPRGYGVGDQIVVFRVAAEGRNRFRESWKPLNQNL